uniref:Uncharacterized protein n=1 Tax=Spiroplasma citri TaxID=2133 RepID=Q3ZVM5_SPICI|nr:hypothetical protein [Spiroplasma citri]CAI94241.1 hypothetical protein [Spiroplasma citri]
MKPFKDTATYDFIANKYSYLKNEIENLEDNYILNVDENTIINSFFDKYEIEPINLLIDEKYAKEDKKEKLGKDFFGNSICYNVTILKVYIPYYGNKNLFYLQPSTIIFFSVEIFINDDNIFFIVELDKNNIHNTKSKIEENIEYLEKNIEYIKNEITVYNNSLKFKIKENIKNRKEKILQSKKILEQLNIPVATKDDNENNTIPVSIIKSKRKKIVQRPKPEIINNFNLDPTISEDIYLEILETIISAGESLEKYPSLYSMKSEEAIRDFILSNLSSNFDNDNLSATSETFNRNGKTDILLKHKNRNIFVAECKIWRGKKQFLDAINQLQSYLTWRDTKTALILFIKEKNISAIIEKINVIISKHPHLISKNKELNEYDIIYDFSFKQDDTKKFQLAVLFYHLPDDKKIKL